MKTDFSFYAALGLCVMPLRGKMPLLSWKKFQDEKPSNEQLQSWDNTNHNIGIITGHISGIFVVDIDGEYPSHWPEMPKTWTVKTSKGLHYYFHLKPEQHFSNRAGLAKNVDIRGNGGYVVAPPSRHPDTGHIYEWIDGPDTHLADIPQWLCDILNPHIPAATIKLIKHAPNEPYIQAAIDGEAAALAMAGEGTRNHQLNRSAFALAQLMDGNKVRAILEPIALSIGLSQKETEKTLSSAIKSALPREIPALEIPDGDCPLVHNLIRSKAPEIPQDIIASAPGLVGQLARWITDTSLYPQPILALAAAIPAIGNVMAHRVATETNLRTNFYTLGIAESGAGKEHARRCIARLYEHVNLSSTLLGDPASASAVINAVKRADARGLMMIDEFGRFLDSLKGSAGHTKMITTNMMYLYNAAGDTFTGQEYANNAMSGGRSDIDQPCLGIYATTVPGRFYGSLTQEDAFDGFLSRWLVFETKRFDIDPNFDRTDINPPEDLIEEIRWWSAQQQITITKSPRIIAFAAQESYYAYIRDCRAKMANTKDAVGKAFWNRAAEHAAKLALVAHTGNTIDGSTFDWAVTLSNTLTQAMIDNISDHISDNRYEADLKKILSTIKKAGADGITKSDLVRRTQFIDRRRRQDILDTMQEAGQIRAEKNDRLTIYFSI